MILAHLIDNTRRVLLQRKANCLEEILREQLGNALPPLDLKAFLQGSGVSIIAEIKRASPSRGVLNPHVDAARLAAGYAKAGADAISVLTEESYFHGSLEDLREARRGLMEAGFTRPLLRKDFIIDPYQLLEARLAGADAVLLIAAALDDATLTNLFEEALALGLTPLVEVHCEEELRRVLSLKPPIIGINNRNLRDFTVDVSVTRRLRPLIPPSCIVVSESGIREPAHMRELAKWGVDAALIGEALVTAHNPFAKLRELKEAGYS